MHIPEYTISPELSAALEHAFAPFLAQERDREPLAYWLDAKFPAEHEYLPPTVTIPLAHMLEQTLALEGGAEGTKLLEAMDGIINGGGNPALLIHGLPKEGAISPILREAFRQKMFVDTEKPFTKHAHLEDMPNYSPEGFSVDGQVVLHQDLSDVGLLFGVNKGVNPRNTFVQTVPEFIKDVSNRTHELEVRIPEAVIAQLLALPIWRVAVTPRACSHLISFELDKDRHARAKQQDIVRVGEDKKTYAPIIYPNPHYDPANPNSQPHEMLVAAFSHLPLRLLSPNLSQVPSELQPYLAGMVEAVASVIKNPPHHEQGPVLDSGDLLLFNNRQLLHAGGVYKREQLSDDEIRQWNRQPRHVISLDVVTQNPAIYPIRPNDRAIQPIQYDGKGFNINPDSLAR